MRLILSAILLCLLAMPAQAEVPLSGSFVASTTCPALQSIRRQTNPGNIATEPGKRYDLVAANSNTPSHFWIVVPGAQPDRRWVAVSCGERSLGASDGASLPVATPDAPHYRGTQYVLAINWQPAFCEISPAKPECRAQTTDSFEATHFTLHGLWPQPREREYCNVSPRDRSASQEGRWRDLPRVRIDDNFRRELETAMPGTLSRLDRHEWTKHGTCYGTAAQEYFSDALDLLLAINTSDVADLFANNIGRKITLRQVRDAFDAAFGEGAGARVSMNCEPDGNRQIITELTIGLTGTINGPDDLPRLLAAASPSPGGCAGGIVDQVGLR